jgi:hypothetical protein
MVLNRFIDLLAFLRTFRSTFQMPVKGTAIDANGASNAGRLYFPGAK